MAVRSAGTSRVPARRLTAAISPTAWDSWRAGITLMPLPAETGTGARSAAVIRVPAGISRAAASTSARWLKEVNAHAPASAPTPARTTPSARMDRRRCRGTGPGAAGDGARGRDRSGPAGTGGRARWCLLPHGESPPWIRACPSATPRAKVVVRPSGGSAPPAPPEPCQAAVQVTVTLTW